MKRLLGLALALALFMTAIAGYAAAEDAAFEGLTEPAGDEAVYCESVDPEPGEVEADISLDADGTGVALTPETDVDSTLMEAGADQLTDAFAASDGLPEVTENAKRIPVLAYHKVVPDAWVDDNRNMEFSVSLSKFNRQMQWLHEQDYTAITCEQLYLWRTNQLRLPKRSVLITFDDGDAGTVEWIIPVLKQYGMRATMFIIGSKTHNSSGSKFITFSRLRKLQRTCSNVIEFQSHTWALHISKNAKQETYEVYAEDAARQRSVYGFSYVAYPYGKHNKVMIQAYKDNGIKMAFLFDPHDNGYATKKQSLFKIKRIEVKGTMSMKRFKKWCK